MLLSENEVVQLLGSVGALLKGHFVLTSGRHADAYIDKDGVFPDPDKLSLLGLEIAAEFRQSGVEVVVAPAEGAIGMAQWVPWHLRRMGIEAKAAYASKEGEGFKFKGAFAKLIGGRRVLVIEDILTTGGSAAKVVELVRATGGEVIGVGVLANRGQVTAEAVGGVPKLVALANVTMESWPEEDCPLCQIQMPISTEAGKGKEYLAKKAAASASVT